MGSLGKRVKDSREGEAIGCLLIVGHGLEFWYVRLPCIGLQCRWDL